ncbi:hypothetical protein HS7_16310 [Sulfolobales archaeon HS-7]|nr:hypothetical protein HS7_16310 [Sulfolobales archaeon HS-7]
MSLFKRKKIVTASETPLGTDINIKCLKKVDKGEILSETKLKWKYEDKGVEYPSSYVVKTNDGFSYQIDEPYLDEKKKAKLENKMKMLYYVIKPSEEDQLIAQILQAIDYDKTMGYYVIRDILRYNVLTPLFDDMEIEDISYAGAGVDKARGDVVWVFHRGFGTWLPTNIHLTPSDADYLVQRIALKAGKSVTLAKPIVDAISPEGYRLALTYGREVSLPGSSISIRKPLEDVWTLSYMIYSKRIMSDWMASAIWYVLENRGVVLVVGRSGTGKTTLINGMLTILPPTWKIVTVEEIPELKVIHPNWVRLISRKSTTFMEYAEAVDIPLDKLIAHTLRIRPDLVSVGEVRTKEELNEFIHSVASGHGGVTSIHAEDFPSLKARFNYSGIDDSFFSIISLVVFIDSFPVNVNGNTFLRRRVQEMGEINLIQGQAVYNRLAVYNPVTDMWDDSDLIKSKRLSLLAYKKGKTEEGLKLELEERNEFFKLTAKSTITEFKSGLQKFYERRGVM